MLRLLHKLIAYRGIIINILFWIYSFLLNKLIVSAHISKEGLEYPSWLAILLIVSLIADTWGSPYSSASNLKWSEGKKRFKFLGGFGAVILIGMRGAFYSVILMVCIKSLSPDTDPPVLMGICMPLMLAREIYIVYRLYKPVTKFNYQESLELLSHFISLNLLCFSMYTLKNHGFAESFSYKLHSIRDIAPFLFGLLVFTFLMFVPLRIVQFYSDLSRTKTKWQLALFIVTTVFAVTSVFF